MNFDYFQIEKMNVTGRTEKVYEKVMSFVLLLCFLPELWYLNCSNKCIFCSFVPTSARNLSLLRQIYIYASESSHDTHSENDMVYRSLSQRL